MKNGIRKNSFFTTYTVKILCNAMMHVKNTRPNPTAMWVEDMRMVRNDALNVKDSLSGKVCGVLVADVY